MKKPIVINAHRLYDRKISSFQPRGAHVQNRAHVYLQITYTNKEGPDGAAWLSDFDLERGRVSTLPGSQIMTNQSQGENRT